MRINGIYSLEFAQFSIDSIIRFVRGPSFKTFNKILHFGRLNQEQFVWKPISSQQFETGMRSLCQNPLDKTFLYSELG